LPTIPVRLRTRRVPDFAAVLAPPVVVGIRDLCGRSDRGRLARRTRCRDRINSSRVPGPRHPAVDRAQFYRGRPQLSPMTFWRTTRGRSHGLP